MFCTLIRIARKAQALLARAARAALHAGLRRLRELWRTHLDRVTTNPGYAAATAAMLAGGLGLLPGRDVLAAVLAATLGIYLRDTRTAGGAMPTHGTGYDFD